MTGGERPLSPPSTRLAPWIFSAGSGGRASRYPAPLAAIALVTALAVAVPIAYVFVRALEPGVAAYLDTVISPLTLRLLGRTLILVALVLAASLALALPLAWLVVRTDLPGRRAWAVLAALPLVFPSYVAALAYVSALGPRGYLFELLAPLGVAALPELVYGLSGAVAVLAIFTYPYLYLLLVAALRGLDPRLEESSRSLGAGPWRTFGRVTLPQLKAPLAAGSLLVVLYTLSDFGAVSIVRYNTFTLAIYNAYSALFDRSVAAALASVLVLLTLGFIAIETLVRRSRPHRLRPSAAPRPQALGRFKVPALLFTGGVALAGVGLPVAVIALWAVRGLRAGNPLAASWQPAVNSFAAAAVAAVAAAALSIPVAQWRVRRGAGPALWVERLCQAGYALPGIVVALALVFLAARHVAPLYQTFALLVAAYVIRFLPEALAATGSALAAVGPRFEEAARSLGRRPLDVLLTVTLPLIRPGLAAGAGLVFLTAMKELPATLILRPTGFDTLATRIWSTAAEGIYSQAAVPSALLVAVSAVPVYWLIIRPSLGR